MNKIFWCTQGNYTSLENDDNLTKIFSRTETSMQWEFIGRITITSTNKYGVQSDHKITKDGVDCGNIWAA